MQTKLSLLFVMGIMLALAGPAQAVSFGAPIDAARSGFVSLRGKGTSCTAVAVAPDLLLAPASCVDPSEVQHPELLGWFMAGQDSVENPVREITMDPRRRFALLRLAGPMDLSAVAARRLLRGPLVLPKNVYCVGYGPQNPAELFPYDGTLSQRNYVIGNRTGDALFINSAINLSVRDLGAVCVDPGSQQIVAMLLGGGLYSVSGVRSWVEEYRAKFEVVAEHSRLCLGNVPNSVLVWQLPCDAAANSSRVNQRWMIRRLGDAGVLQIRPSRYPDLCLGVTNGSGADGAEVRFSSCLPDLTNPYPAALPTVPRPEQVWAATHLGGDAVQLRNTMTGKCLDVTGVSVLAFARLQQWTCLEGQPNQRFLINVDGFAQGTHQLVPFYNASTTLGIFGGARTNGTLVISWARTGMPDQEFNLTRSADLAYQNMGTLWSGSCIDVPAGSVADVGLQEWSCWGGENQQFMFRWLPQQIGYRIRPRHTIGRCLTMGAAAGTGSPVMSTLCGVNPKLKCHPNAQSRDVTYLRRMQSSPRPSLA